MWNTARNDEQKNNVETIPTETSTLCEALFETLKWRKASEADLKVWHKRARADENTKPRRRNVQLTCERVGNRRTGGARLSFEVDFRSFAVRWGVASAKRTARARRAWSLKTKQPQSWGETLKFVRGREVNDSAVDLSASGDGLIVCLSQLSAKRLPGLSWNREIENNRRINARGDRDINDHIKSSPNRERSFSVVRSRLKARLAIFIHDIELVGTNLLKGFVESRRPAGSAFFRSWLPAVQPLVDRLFLLCSRIKTHRCVCVETARNSQFITINDREKKKIRRRSGATILRWFWKALSKAETSDLQHVYPKGI